MFYNEASFRKPARQSYVDSPNAFSGVDDLTEIAELVKAVGKHHLPARFLVELDRRRVLAPSGSMESIFLACVLDKYDDAYDYESYLCLPLVRLLTEREEHHGEQIAALLISDSIRFELASRDSGASEESILRKRVHRGLAQLKCLGVVFEPGLEERLISGEAVALEQLPAARDSVAELLSLSVLPVDVYPDEYMFIRVLQTFEVLTSRMVESAISAVTWLGFDQPANATENIAECAAMIRRVQRLFSLMATIPPDVFQAFRQFTEGASAIQSRRYKEFELLCGRPEQSRLNSPAFENVSDVQAEADKAVTISQLVAERARNWDATHCAELFNAMRVLEDAHQAWKVTHVSVATRMLGDSPGSGYTSGVPYLRSVVDNRLFWSVSAAMIEGAK